MKDAPLPKKRELFFLRTMILVVLGYAVYFIQWFFNADIIGHRLLFGLICITLVYRFLRLLHQWVHLFFLPRTRATHPHHKDATVDVFTTYCPGEPYEMVEETLLSIKAITYPHGTFLCCEGYDERLATFCEQHQIHFVPREERVNAKAGNVNNALRHSDADICVILDPDHRPDPDFIDVVLPPFQDEKVGFVQVPQIYYNHDTSLVAKGAAQQTYEFYGPLLTASTRFGTSPAIGANCTFRRTALDSIGGHAPGLTEDMHTSMLLHAKGWKSVYLPTPVSEGLVPANLSSFFKQQLKWSRGSFELFFKVLPGIMKNLTWSQRMHYLSVPLYFTFGLLILIDFFIPVFSLFTGNYPLRCRMDDLAVMLAPLVTGAWFIKLYAQRWYYAPHEKGLHFYGEVLRLSSWWVNLMGLLYAIIGVKVPYIPTPKEEEVRNEWKISLPNIAVVLLIVIAVIVGLYHDRSDSALLMAGYVSVFGLLLTAGVVLGAAQTLNRPWLQSIIHNVSFSWQWIGRKTAFLPFILALLLWAGYYGHYRNRVHPLGAVQPPEHKDVGGLYIANEQGTGNVVYINRLTDTSVSASKMAYLHLSRPIYDSVALISRVDSVCDWMRSAGRNTVFLDILPVSDSISPVQYKKRWQQVRSTFMNRGHLPVMVFRFSSEQILSDYLPDTRFVDWLCLEGDSSYADLHTQMMEVHVNLLDAERHVMLHLPEEVSAWQNDVKNALTYLDYSELSGCVTSSVEVSNDKLAPLYFISKGRQSVESATFPFAIRGVHYNVSQDWKDDFQTLTRKSVRRDLLLLKEIGANTVLRFGPTAEEDNLLKEAELQELKVLYGLNIEAKTNFTDSLETAALKATLLRVVREKRTHNAIAGWVIGDGVLQELANYYAEPYVRLQQQSFLRFTNRLTEEIHRIDDRPVALHTALNAKTKIELGWVKQFAPNIKTVGLGLYYASDTVYFSPIAQQHGDECSFYFHAVGTDHFADKLNPNHKEYHDLDSTIVAPKLIELTDAEKAEMLKNMLTNLENYETQGVVLRSYTDKMEGTFTWNGLTDFRGRKKPSLYAVQSQWSDGPEKIFPKVSITADRTYFEEDSVYTFTANVASASAKLEWMLCKNDIIPLEGAIVHQEANSVTVKIPNDPENLTTYRLFVFASQGDDVVTNSYFIPLRWYYK